MILRKPFVLFLLQSSPAIQRWKKTQEFFKCLYVFGLWWVMNENGIKREMWRGKALLAFLFICWFRTGWRIRRSCLTQEMWKRISINWKSDSSLGKVIKKKKKKVHEELGWLYQIEVSLFNFNRNRRVISAT